MTGIGIIRTAHYLGLKKITNDRVCFNIPGLTPEWILEKTGIKQRYRAMGFQTSHGMASMVAYKLLEDTGITNIGLIIVASFSQELLFPALANGIHRYVEAPKDCQTLDINTNCTGLITGTTIAVERMRSDPSIEYALVIGVEHLSKHVNPEDKFTAPFFSDGASGILLGRVPEGYGYQCSAYCTDSSAYDDVKCERGKYIYHNGKTTWTQAITNVPYVMKKAASMQRMLLSDIDFFIFHQANKVLIDYIMDKNRIPREKTYTNVEEIGNTGAASIGIALDEAIRKGYIKSGMTVMLAGVGAGFNFGASIWKMQ